MKHLTIIVDGQTQFDADVSYFQYEDDGGTVTVRGGNNKPRTSRPGLGQLFAGAAGELARNGKP